MSHEGPSAVQVADSERKPLQDSVRMSKVISIEMTLGVISKTRDMLNLVSLPETFS